MPQGLRILGMDPALRNIGVALMLYNPGVGVELEDLKLIVTKKESKKRNLRSKSDDLRCLEHIRDEVALIAKTWVPDVVAFEAYPTGGVSRLAAAKIAVSWGTCWGLLTAKRGILSFEYDPADLKQVVTGKSTASKLEMVETLSQRYPGLVDLDVPESKKEHPADAIAACLQATQEPAVIRLAESLDRMAG